ncbi:MAG: hypothetical protein HOP34_01050 [Methylococcaceae bacterium]|nr:hypothetical protein [Methylococcaceae bacterium]
MQQSRLASFIEALANALLGYFVALASQLVLFPFFDIHIPISTNLWIGAWFTLISIVRSYILRRWFNARLHRIAEQMAKNLS